MKAKVYNLSNDETQDLELNKDIFDISSKSEVVNLVVVWQRAKKQAGTHSTKNISEVSGTGKKPHRQKGTGRARLGTLRANQCRGGGIVRGPVPRSHEISMPKKVRKLALRMVLSQKLKDNKLFLLDSLALDKISTKLVDTKIKKIALGNKLIVGSKEDKENAFVKSVMNIKNCDFLPEIGLNVYDILKHDNLIITIEAIKNIEARLAK